MNKPKHGERTKNAIWLDETAYQEPIEDPRQGLHLLDCDASPCDYSYVDALVSDDPIELTYNAEYGLWLCPTHWFDVETKTQPYEAPRLTTYGNTTPLMGNH